MRDHRVHHKFTDTNADPHNSQRGFFFSHMGWLLSKKHPDVKIKGKLIDMSDLESDRMVMFQHKYFLFIMPIIHTVIPFLFIYYILGDTAQNALFVGVIFRWTYTLHATWCVNSWAHIWGTKPYDK